MRLAPQRDLGSHSSKISMSSLRSGIASEVAELKANLSFMDFEAPKSLEIERKRSELERFKVMRDIPIADAKMEYIIKIKR